MTKAEIDDAVAAEREAQQEKHGALSVGGPVLTWAERGLVIAEEAGEVAKAALDLHMAHASLDVLDPVRIASFKAALRAELVQMVACGFALLERL